MDLSVIILNYKVPFHLMLCIESAQKALQNLDAEIIVVDNASEDQSVAWTTENFPKVKVIANPENSGFSKGNNIGIKEARGKYICLLNPDTVVPENTFQALLKFGQEHSDAGAISPKYIDGTGNFLPESKRNLPTPKVALQKLLNQSQNYYAELAENATGAVQILAGAFMLMRKDRYWEVGGLDEDYFMYGEDIDLCYKFLQAGYQNYYVGSEKIIHFKGESTVKDATYRKRFYGAMHIFYQKHFQQHKLASQWIKTGLHLAKLRNRFKGDHPTVQKSPKNYYWVSTQIFPKKLAEKFDQSVTTLDLQKANSQFFKESYFIFDAESISYSEIAIFMEKNKNNQNHFRIKPVNFTFSLGSDQANHQGETLKW